MTALRSPIEKSSAAFRSIGEAASELGLETHVLRYWETRFPKEVRPVKRPDGRRMFRPEDMDALRAIRALVHERGMTLKGASPARELQESVARAFGALDAPGDTTRQDRLEGALRELSDIKTRIDALRARRVA